jgi:predicted nucleic acid-binding protein
MADLGLLAHLAQAAHQQPQVQISAKRQRLAAQLPPSDELVDARPILERLANRLALFRSRPDKEWGLIDCTSFIAMSDRSLTKALTADEHFEQCGFRALLRDHEP